MGKTTRIVFLTIIATVALSIIYILSSLILDTKGYKAVLNPEIDIGSKYFYKSPAYHFITGAKDTYSNSYWVLMTQDSAILITILDLSYLQTNNMNNIKLSNNDALIEQGVNYTVLSSNNISPMLSLEAKTQLVAGNSGFIRIGSENTSYLFNSETLNIIKTESSTIGIGSTKNANDHILTGGFTNKIVCLSEFEGRFVIYIFGTNSEMNLRDFVLNTLSNRLRNK